MFRMHTRAPQLSTRQKLYAFTTELLDAQSSHGVASTQLQLAGKHHSGQPTMQLYWFESTESCRCVEKLNEVLNNDSMQFVPCSISLTQKDIMS